MVDISNHDQKKVLSTFKEIVDPIPFSHTMFDQNNNIYCHWLAWSSQNGDCNQKMVELYYEACKTVTTEAYEQKRRDDSEPELTGCGRRASRAPARARASWR